MKAKVLILPGLDGTGKLLQRFVRIAPANVVCEPVIYDDDLVTLDDFVNTVANKLGRGDKKILITESFSGPIAAQVALRYPDHIAAIIFVASFVEPPHKSLLRLTHFMPYFLFGIERSALVRHFCLNGVRDENIIDEALTVVRALRSVTIKRRFTVLDNLTGGKTMHSDIPVLSLCAATDRLMTSVATSSIARMFPSTTRVDVKAPHFLLLTQPEECWHHIKHFLANN